MLLGIGSERKSVDAHDNNTCWRQAWCVYTVILMPGETELLHLYHLENDMLLRNEDNYLELTFQPWRLNVEDQALSHLGWDLIAFMRRWLPQFRVPPASHTPLQPALLEPPQHVKQMQPQILQRRLPKQLILCVRLCSTGLLNNFIYRAPLIQGMKSKALYVKPITSTDIKWFITC